MRPAVIALSLVFGLLIPPPALADPAWQKLKNLGEVEDLGAHYAKGLVLFERALKLMPPNDLHGYLQTQCSLVGDLLRLDIWPRAGEEADLALRSAQKMREKNQLNSDDVAALNGIADCCDRPVRNSEPFLLRVKANVRNGSLRLKVMDFINPKSSRLFKMHMEYARTFLIAQDPKGANAEFDRMKEMAKTYAWELTSSEKFQMLLNPLATNELLGVKNPYDSARQVLSKDYSEATILVVIGEAQSWAVNYPAAIKTFDRALAVDKARKKGTKSIEKMIYQHLGMTYADEGVSEKAELCFRKWVAEAERTKSADLFDAKHWLASTLRAQNKMDEAKKIMPEETGANGQGLKGWDWILTDKEKSDVTKNSEKHKTSTPPSFPFP